MLKFSQIEKSIDQTVLNYIRNNCYEKKYVRTDIKFIRELPNGKEYTSRMIFEDVLDEKKYEKLVLDYYNQYLRENLETTQNKKRKYKKRELGKDITKKEAFAVLFSDNFEHRKNEIDKNGRKIGMKAFVANIDRETHIIEQAYPVHNLNKMIEKTVKYKSFTGNLFIHHKHFTKEMLSLLNVIILDFDLDEARVVMSKEELFKLIKKKIGIEVSMIWDTRTTGNYQAAILLEKMTGHIQSVYFYEAIVREMCHKLGKIVDKSCIAANHMFTVPENNKRKGKSIRFYNDTRHSPDEFRAMLKDRDERRRKEESIGKKVIDFTKKSIENHEAIQALMQGENINFRNHACLTLALLLKFLDYDENEAENYIKGYWIAKVNGSQYDHPFTEYEATKIIRRVYSNRYKNFHSKWVEICTGIECNLSAYFRSGSYISKEKYKTKNEQTLLLFFEENNSFEGTKSELAEVTGIKFKTLEKILPKLKQNGILEYETKRGKGSKTKYKLIQASEVAVFKEDKFRDIKIALQQLAELEEISYQIQN